MKIFLFLLFVLKCLNTTGQNNIIDQLLDRPVIVTVIEGDTFLQRDLIDYLNLTLGMNDKPSGNTESDELINMAILKDYFLRPHPDVATVQKYFHKASEEFGVPVPLLMVIGQIENNWTQTGPTIDQGWGIMHLVQNNYCNTLGEAAQLIGVPEQILKDDARQNIRASAALIAKYAGEESFNFTELEDWFPAVAQFSGLINSELKNIQAIDFFETLKKGVTANTVWGEEISIESRNEIDMIKLNAKYNFGNTGFPESSDYGPALANFAPSCNYAGGRSHSIDTWVNHYVGTGNYAGAISWFLNCSSSVSAHFVIRSSDGQITQCVSVANTAWHCGATGYVYNNSRSIGVEHEATAANPGLWNSAPMLTASATMACYFQQQYDFPTTQNTSPGICGHSDMPGTSTACPGALPWSTWMSDFNSECTEATTLLCNNDYSCGPPSPYALTITSSCVNIGCSTVGATPPSPNIDFYGGTSCSNIYSSSRYDDDVWFTITPANYNQITIKVTPTSNLSNFDPVVGLYMGNCMSPTQIGCATAGGSGGTEQLVFTPTSLSTYLIRVFSYGIGSTYSGNFDICVTSASSGTDPCSSISSINGCGSSYSKTYTGGGTGLWFTSSENDCEYTSPGIEKIYSFVAPTTGTYSIQVTAASGYVDYLWKSSSCSSSGWNCIDDINSTGTFGSLTWTAGSTYFLLLDDEDGSTGTHTFYINCAGSTCPNLTRQSDAVTISGTNVSFNITIINNGTASSGSSEVGYYLSTSPSMTTNYLIGTDYVTSLAVNGTSNETFSIDVTTITPLIPPGTYYASYIIDHLEEIDECYENDNRYYLSTPTVIIPNPTNPVITVTPGSLNFGNVEIGTNSNPQSYSLNWSDLTNDITVSSNSSNFKVSLSQNSGYVSSLSIPINKENVDNKENVNDQNSYNVIRGERPPIDLDKVPKEAYEPGKLKIKLMLGSEKILPMQVFNAGEDGYVITGIEKLDSLNRAFGVSAVKPLFSNLYETKSMTTQYIERHKAWGFHLWFELSVDDKIDVIEAVKRFAALDEVDIAEPEYKKELVYQNLNSDTSTTVKEKPDITDWIPIDPRFNEQWHYHNTGQQSGTTDKDINLPEAWEIEKGNSSVIVAIIDGGIQTNHPDLSGNIWAGIGYNFVNNNSTIVESNHGTHVAGTVAGENNNNIGISGVAGGSGSNDGVRLMSCQVFLPDGTSGDFHSAFIYAADNGAAISQNSWQYIVMGYYDQVVLDAIDYFNTNGGGSVLDGGVTIFAAGNNNSSGNYYPGCYSGTLSVAATNNQDIKSSYSNYGSWVDISAPGGETNSVLERGVLSSITGNSYDFYQGTSMACPHVSGVAALLISYAFRNGFTLNKADVWSLLVDNTDDHYAQNPAFSGQLGSGRLNAYNSLMAVTLPNQTNIWVRFEPGTTGSLSGTISNASTGATTQNVSVTGVGLQVCKTCPEYDISITPSTSWQSNTSSHEAGGCKIYRVSVSNGQSYIFKTGCGDGATANYDTYLELFDNNCNLQEEDDDNCESYRSLIEWTASFTGYVYLKVSGISNDYGDYTLSYIRCTIPGQPGTITGTSPVCQGMNNVSYSVPAIANAQTYIWEYSGTGHTINGSSNNITISFSAAATPGNLTVTGDNNCGTGPVSANFPITVNSAPTANAGTNSTICQGSTHTLSASATNYGTLSWTTSGTGTFSSNTILNPVYTPSTADITAGTVTLTLTASAVSPCTTNASSSKTLTIQKTPTASAGTNATICQGSTHTLTASATNYGTLSWTTSGTGTFSSNTILNPVYTPSAADITTGTVTLTLTASAVSPCTANASSSKTLTIQKTPTASAGTNATICHGSTHTLSASAANYGALSWTTSGTGTFSSTTILNPVYTPSAADISAGSVTLTLTASAISPCTTSAASGKTLTIQKTPTANAGTNATICQGSTHSLSASTTNYGSLAWTTSGTGTFSSTTILNPVYTPSAADITAGTLTLTLTVSAVSPCTTNASSSKTLTIQKTPTVNAGTNATICQGSTHTLSASASNYGSLLWTTSGTGTFSSNTILNPVYTPSTADINAGLVTLTLTASAVSPCTANASSGKTLTIQKAPTANAGNDVSIPQGGTYNLTGTATNYASVLWTTSGNGTFSNNGILNPVYTPGTTDISSGSVQLCLLANGLTPCTNVTDCMTLTISQTTSDQITLYSGWNLISFDVTPNPATPVSVFASLIANNNLLMVTGYEQGGLMYDPNGLPFLNTLTEIKNGFGYWVKVTNAATLSVTGASISPTFSMNLKTGWNLVAYWPAETTTPEAAFAPLISIGVLQTVTGYEQGGLLFDPNGLPFLNTLTEIKNGFGYWVKLNADYNGFSYPVWECGQTIIDDRDGETYTTVQIGSQCWMKQNLNIGTRIEGAVNQTNNGTIEKYCYNNLETNCDVYGGFYQWNEMMQYTAIEGVQGICPTGWHVPTDAEWTALTTYVSGQPAWLCNSNSSYIAKALAATTNWNTSSNTCAVGNNLATNNATGFSGLPAGIYNSGSFDNQGSDSYFWSATQYSSDDSWGWTLGYIYRTLSSGNLSQSLGFSVRCLKNESTQVNLPSLITSDINTITSISAISGGDVNSDGGVPVTARGVCWSTSQNPTIANSITTNGTGPGAFTSNIIGLTPGTTYYVRAYATNSVGTAYGNQLSFVTLAIQCPTSFTDSRDGKVYTTVQIGTQCWMKQNLNIGTRINGSTTQTNNGTIEKYCYNNLETNCDIYGGLYQWDEMMEYSTVEGVQGICPTGWHVPNDAEWTALTTYISSQSAYLCNSNNTYIAKAMAFTSGWNTYGGTCAVGNNQAGNNATSFSGLPGGYRSTDGSFYRQSLSGLWWSSSQYSSSGAYLRYLYYDYAVVNQIGTNKSEGYSVRCLKD